MLEKWLIVAAIAGIMSGAAYLKGLIDGSEDYYALVAKLDRTTIIVQKATEKANVTRKAEKERTAEIFAGLDVKLTKELDRLTKDRDKLSMKLGKVDNENACAIPDADRIRLSDAVVEAANSTIRVPASGKANPEKVPVPVGAGLGKEVGA